MPIPFKSQRSPVPERIRRTEVQWEKDVEWIVWWYCGIRKNIRANSQPNVLVGFRQINGQHLSDEMIFRWVLLEELGQMRIGTVWKNGECKEEAVLTPAKFEVNFSRDHWCFRSFCENNSRGLPPPFPMSLHPLYLENDKNWLVRLSLSNGRRLLIPCLEFFSRCYGRSQELKRVLATYPWLGPEHPSDVRLFAPIDEPEEEGKFKVKLRKRMVNGDVIFLAHAKYDPDSEKAAKEIYAQIERQYVDEKTIVFLQAGPWFKGPAQLKVNGIWSADKATFLALQIEGCTDPEGFPIFRDRDNTNKTGPEEDEVAEGKAWEGSSRRIIKRPKEIVDLTADSEPDHGAATIEIEDPDFEVLGIPRTVIDIRRSTTKSTSGAKRDGGQPNAYSGGEPYGDDKGVGYAHISAETILESQGALRDIWNAARYIRDTRPDLIQSVEFFTFERGFSSEAEPRLIPLQKFDECDDGTTAGIRDWVYLHTGAIRGLLVMRLRAQGSILYLIEVQRGLQKAAYKRGDPECPDETFRGFMCRLFNNDDFEWWLREFLWNVRYAKGVVHRLVADCPGDAGTFKHTPAQDEEVPGEAAVLNGLQKMGLK
ncbi:MAG TPA: hypothetical protein VIT91_11020 [Chthoniobacterales bacterium]